MTTTVDVEMSKVFVDRRKSSVVDAATLKFAGIENKSQTEDSEAGYLKKDLDEQYKIRKAYTM